MVRAGSAIAQVTMLTPGTVLDGRYRVGEEIGAGGMGIVYEATQLGLNRRVAIKVLPEELASEALFVERFRREAETAATLGSPHIVQVTDFVRTEEVTFLVMERLYGRSLLELLQERERLEEAQAIDIASQLLGGLAVAHEAGVVHRDLKPGNVFLVSLASGGALVKLLDFGIARLMESTGYTRLTSTGVIVGTPRYASPEQVSGRPVDVRSDLFSAGVLLYGMVTGRPPFLKEGAALAVEIMTEEPPDPRSLRDVSAGMAELLWKALRKDPAQRFQSAAEMGRALGHLGGRAWTSSGEGAAIPLPTLDRTGQNEVPASPVPTLRTPRPVVDTVPPTPLSGTPFVESTTGARVALRTPASPLPARREDLERDEARRIRTDGRSGVPPTSQRVPTTGGARAAGPSRNRMVALILAGVILFLLGSVAAGVAIALVLGEP